MPKKTPDLNHLRELWLKTAKSRLRFELGGLAFAIQKGFTPEEYANHLWGKGAKSWMKKAAPDAGEYLQKEAEAFRCFYPEVGFEVVQAEKDRAELNMNDGCLGGWGKERWAIARSFGLTQLDVCRYCFEAFRVWAKQLGLRTVIGLQPDGKHCILRASRD